jgi:2-polyprenyl-3-methyl-5-hydroxy-6-metoxy-1,4-benzoquinol methylase
VATDERPCPACAAAGPHPRHLAPGKEAIGGEPLELARCSSCSARFQPRVPTEAELARWYDYMGHIPVNLQSSPLLDRRLARLVAVFDDVRRTGRLLEIGCGGGLLVRAAIARGWQVWGTEISPSCVALLQPLLGARLYQGTVVEAPFERDSFDAVAMIEVIEHLVDPLPYLVAVRRLLRPGGRLFLTTPNAVGAAGRVLGTRWRAYTGEHLNYFDRHSIAVLLERAGFAAPDVTTSNVDLLSFARSMWPQLINRRAPPASPPRSTTAASRPPAAMPVAMPVTRAAAFKASLLDAAIETVNHAANFLRLGDTLRVVAERPVAG